MNKILVIGSSNTDMVVSAERLPVAGETVLGGVFSQFAGGKGANQAVAAERAGGEVFFVCAVGDDDFGSQALENYQREGIDISMVKKISDAVSGIALIMVDGEGENIISVDPGANDLLMPDDIDGIDWSQFKAVVLQMEIPFKTVLHAVKSAHDAGCKVFLNCAPARKIPEDAFESIDYLIVNRGELEVVSGNKIDNDTGIVSESKMLVEKGIANVIVTLGKDGVVFVNRMRSEYIKAFEVTAVDTVGAGDCFTGCFSAAISEGMTFKDAIEFACAGAALSVQKEGAQASMPGREEIESFVCCGNSRSI